MRWNHDRHRGVGRLMRTLPATVVLLLTALATGCTLGAGEQGGDPKPRTERARAPATTPAVVPDVRGMDAFRAAERLANAGFPVAVQQGFALDAVAVQQGFALDASGPPVEVGRQCPAPGTRMRRDRAVRLVLRYGCCLGLNAPQSDPFTMPDLRGLPLDRALAELADAVSYWYVRIDRIPPTRGSLLGRLRVERQWPVPGRVDPVPYEISHGERPPRVWVTHG
jgi:hypothetical protein